MAELSTPAPSRKRRLWRWLGLAAATIVLLVVLAIAALQSPPARRYILERATQMLAAQDITFSSDGFSYNLLDLSTELRDVKVFSKHLPDAPPFLTIDRIRLDLSSWQLMRGRYVLQGGNAQ